jgi:hypothetical protein
MASNMSEAETQQLLRTIEMFEAITQSQPDDYQSLEILKEAYNKVGRLADGVRISKKLASSYVNIGQISQAILEYEGILQECPDDSNVRAELADLEAKTAKRPGQQSPGAPSLDADSKPKPPAGASAGVPLSSESRQPSDDDADRSLANVLIAEKITTMQAVQPLLLRVQAGRRAAADKGQPVTLLQLLVDEQSAKLEDLLNALVDKSGLAYLPLSVYDVDRDVASLLPAELCFKACIVPFDIISRSILIATANPFDAATRERVATMLHYNPFWYVCAPQDIAAALRKTHGLDSGQTVGSQQGRS